MSRAFVWPDQVINTAAVFLLPILLALGVSRALGMTSISDTILLYASFFLAVFATLRLCLETHIHVRPSSRRVAAFAEVVIGLALIWATAVYAVPRFTTWIDSSIERLPANGPKVIMENGIYTDAAAEVFPSRKTTPSNPVKNPGAAGWLLLVAGLVAGRLLWGLEKRLVAPRRYRLNLAVAVTAWVLASAMWLYYAEPFKMDQSLDIASDATPPTQRASDEQGPSSRPTPGNDSAEASSPPRESPATLSAPHLIFIFILLLLIVTHFISWFLPLYFSIPFAQLFLAECTNTSLIARVWIISLVVSSVAIVIALPFASTPHLHAPSILVAAVLTWSVIGALVIYPVIRDVPTAWIALHVTAITSFAVMAFFLAPGSATLDEYATRLMLPATLAALTVLHLLFGLYRPKMLVWFDRVNQALCYGAFFTAGVLLVRQSPLLLTAGPYLLWIVVLTRLVPCAERYQSIFDFRRLVGYRRLHAPALDGVPSPSSSTQDPPQPSTGAGYLGTRRRTPRSGHARGSYHEVVALRRVPPLQFVFASLCAMMAAVFVAVAVDPVAKAPMHVHIQGWLIILAMATVSALLFRYCYRIASSKLFVSARGVALVGRKKIITFLSPESVSEYRLDPVRRHITVRAQAGVRVLVTHLDPDHLWLAASAFELHFLESIMTGVWNSMETEGGAQFGPLTATAQGVNTQGHTLKWHDVTRIKYATTSVAIYKHNSPEAWSAFNLSRVPNIIGLITLHACFHASRLFNERAERHVNQSPSTEGLTTALVRDPGNASDALIRRIADSTLQVIQGNFVEDADTQLMPSPLHQAILAHVMWRVSSRTDADELPQSSAPVSSAPGEQFEGPASGSDPTPSA